MTLEPLRVEHAAALAPLLDDAELHTFIGGSPASVAELEERYRRQTAGYSADGVERWLNWVVRNRAGEAIGTVQSTIRPEGRDVVAEVAWVIASPHQGHGYGRDAAQTMVRWLRRQGADAIVAHIHPDHGASAAVARAAGLEPTTAMVDGEIRWRLFDRALVTAEVVRTYLAGLPRSYEVFVRGRWKFRVGQIVYVAFSKDETMMGFAFPKEERQMLVETHPDRFVYPRESDLRFNWVVARLDRLSRREMEELTFDAWRMVVPQKVAAEAERSGRWAASA